MLSQSAIMTKINCLFIHRILLLIEGNRAVPYQQPNCKSSVYSTLIDWVMGNVKLQRPEFHFLANTEKSCLQLCSPMFLLLSPHFSLVSTVSFTISILCFDVSFILFISNKMSQIDKQYQNVSEDAQLPE